jgi:hypothetical protein
MSSNDEVEPAPKESENDPPAADQPVADSPGSPPASGEAPHRTAGRVANDPSLTQDALAQEVMQVPPGKPDGEVDTATAVSHPQTQRKLDPIVHPGRDHPTE